MKATQNPTPATADVEPTPADILRGAALYIELHGLHQGELFATGTAAGFPPACALGAIWAATTGHTIATCPDLFYHLAVFERVIDGFAAYLRTYGYIDTDDHQHEDPRVLISDWNDTPSRFPNHVIAALHNAADNSDHGR